MDINQLKINLLQAYQTENLNKISIVLLNLYKNHQFETLQKIADFLSDFVTIKIAENGKGFSKFMMLYHPDRGAFHIENINVLTAQNNFDKLLEYSHILKLERIEEMTFLLESLEDIDYSPVYEWDFEANGFSVTSNSKRNGKAAKYNTKPNKNVCFYDAIKIRQYGQKNISFPTWYLEDIDEFEMAGSDIDNLDGIQYCVHAQNIDLSDNSISEINLLNTLGLLEFLNLSDNRIENIEPLAGLPKLKEINLANNRIRDISPLLMIPNLEFVDLTGNPLTNNQIDKLLKLKINVEY